MVKFLKEHYFSVTLLIFYYLVLGFIYSSVINLDYHNHAAGGMHISGLYLVYKSLSIIYLIGFILGFIFSKNERFNFFLLLIIYSIPTILFEFFL